MTDPSLSIGHPFPDDESVMQHALQLAAQGRGAVEPNPMVGAVIVDTDRRLISQGWHRHFGAAHAEVMAIQNASQTDGTRLFVTLEPCSHHGKTPPCADAVIKAGFAEVIIGCQDPAPHVAGQGIDRIRKANIDVVVGLCEADADALICPFSMLHTNNRPWVHAKWAMTLDGRIATASGHSQWISNETSRAIVHQLRGRVDAIITGAGTVRADNPTLTARPPGPRRAARIVIDASGTSVDLSPNLLATVDQAPLIIAVSDHISESRQNELQAAGAELLVLPEAQPNRLCVSSLLQELGQREMTNVLVEAGSEIAGAFFDQDLIDEVHVFIAPKLAGGNGARSPLGGIGRQQIPNLPDLIDCDIRTPGGDVYISGRVRRD